MDKKELKIHQQFHRSLYKEKKKENELLKAREEKRQRAWKLAEVTEPILVKQLAGN
tara:strand:- start:213 stop:380 length:168 start_codon:yes stop_codon:yes gene_type:complete